MKAFHEVRNYPSDFMLWHKQYENICFLAHWHREIELIYIRKGNGTIHVIDEAINAKEGDLILCDSGDIHYCDVHSPKFVLDFLIFDTSIVSSHYTYPMINRHVLDKKFLSEHGLDKKLKNLLCLIDDEMDNNKEYFKEIITGELRGFWYQLIREIPKKSGAESEQSGRRKLLADFQKTLSYLEEHYDENIRLSDAASMMGFTESHFSRLFKKLTGTGFVKYLNFIRVSQAAELLISSDKTISYIASECGFTNTRTFNRVFLDITGQTPSAFANNPESRHYNPTYYRSSDNYTTTSDVNPTIAPEK